MAGDAFVWTTVAVGVEALPGLAAAEEEAVLGMAGGLKSMLSAESSTKDRR